MQNTNQVGRSMNLTEEIVEKARLSIGENEKRRKETIQIIRQWIQQQPHLSTVPTGRLVNFIPISSINGDAATESGWIVLKPAEFNWT